MTTTAIFIAAFLLFTDLIIKNVKNKKIDIAIKTPAMIEVTSLIDFV